jgi:phenylalanyl-tRNA synthetase alpha chain
MTDNLSGQVQNLLQKALEQIQASKNTQTLKEIEVKYLGRKGELTELLKTLKDVPADQKPIIGQTLQKAKTQLETAYQQKLSALENEEITKQLTNEFFDITLPGIKPEAGSIHPLSQLQEEVETIFSEMGFSIMDGPEVESEYYNFEALNIPAHHPARDMQDTFFIENHHDEQQGNLVLRTHTSPVQIRSMLKHGAPLKIIVPGRVFRYEATDASHDNTFYQVEGLLIDKNVSLASLKGVMRAFLTRLFGKEVKVRFRPGYFPFVEPGLELDFSCLICNEKGCSVCKHTGWMEFMGSGMVHSNVLKAGGIDPDEYQGWAFGFGLTRLAVMRYAMNDVRLLQSGDLRFIKQF